MHQHTEFSNDRNVDNTRKRQMRKKSHTTTHKEHEKDAIFVNFNAAHSCDFPPQHVANVT